MLKILLFTSFLFFGILAQASSLQLGLTTQVPLQIGGQVKWIHDSGFLVQSTMGKVPEAYVNVANNFATGMGWYSDQDAELIADLLPNSTFLNFGLGYKGLIQENIFFTFNYFKLTSAAQTTGKTFLEVLLQRTIPSASGGNNIDLEGEIQGWMATLGYEMQLQESWLLNFDLSLTHPMSSTSQLGFSGNFPVLEQALNDELDSYLNDLWGSVWIGSIGVTVLYQF